MVKLSDLKAKRAAMTQGEWWISDLDGDVCAGPEGADFVTVGPVDWRGEDLLGAVLTHNAADVLIEIAEAAWADEHTRCNCDAEYGHLARCDRFDIPARMLAALAKIKP